MPGKRHPRSVKLAAVFLTRQSGIEAAAKTFGVDPRTIEAWTASGDLPQDEWTAIRDVLRARAGEMAAKGETSGLVATMTAAGIADRNVRYTTLIARREARRDPEAETERSVDDPVRAALDRLSPAAREHLRVLIAMRMWAGPAEGVDAGLVSDREDTTGLIRLIDAIGALSDEDLAIESAAAAAEWARVKDLPRPRTADAKLMAIVAESEPEPEPLRPEPVVKKPVDPGDAPGAWSVFGRFELRD
jgi:hypothetical protein